MTQELDATFNSIMKTMIETGQAPHYVELAADLGLTPPDGRERVHELMNHIGLAAVGELRSDLA